MLTGTIFGTDSQAVIVGELKQVRQNLFTLGGPLTHKLVSLPLTHVGRLQKSIVVHLEMLQNQVLCGP